MDNKIKIFVSYSHQNEDWVSNNGKYKLIPWLEKQLEDVAEIWTDHTLKRLPGEEYTKLITKKIYEADFALLLISQDFISSKYIIDTELPLIRQYYLDGKIKILPLLLTDLTKNGKEKISWIYDLQIYPNDTKPLYFYTNNDAEWEKIKVEILDGIENKISAILNPHDKTIEPEIKHSEETSENREISVDVNENNITGIECDKHKNIDKRFGVSLLTKKLSLFVGISISISLLLFIIFIPLTINRTLYHPAPVEITIKRSIETTGFYIDKRDGHSYKWIKIGSQIWFAENLAYKTSSGCLAHNNEIANANRYGYLYTWNAAKIACPAGWHLPSDEEWKVLETYLTNNGYNFDGSKVGNKLGKSLASTSEWSENLVEGNVGNNQKINNKTGFSALPSGYKYNNGYYGFGTIASWWSSTEYKQKYALRRSLYYNFPDLRFCYDRKDHYYAVRCIKD